MFSRHAARVLVRCVVALSVLLLMAGATAGAQSLARM